MSTCTNIAPAAGDIFTSEVAPHLHGLYRMALRLTQEEQAAQDLLQDTLERAFLNFKRYESATNIRAWLLRIMSNVRISGFRRSVRRPQTSSLEDAEDFSLYRAVRGEGIAPPDVESAVLNRIGEETILKAIDKLPRTSARWWSSRTSKDSRTKRWQLSWRSRWGRSHRGCTVVVSNYNGRSGSTPVTPAS